jgi:hypothetical protein
MDLSPVPVELVLINVRTAVETEYELDHLARILRRTAAN